MSVPVRLGPLQNSQVDVACVSEAPAVVNALEVTVGLPNRPVAPLVGDVIVGFKTPAGWMTKLTVLETPLDYSVNEPVP